MQSTVTAQFEAKKLGRNLYLRAQVNDQTYTWVFWWNIFRKSRVKDVMESLASLAFNRVLSGYGGYPPYAYLELFPIPGSNAIWPEGGEDEPGFGITITITFEDDGWLFVTTNSYTTRTTVDELFVTLDSMISNILLFYL